MRTINYDDCYFRSVFPAFLNELTFPPATIQNYWDLATTYISNQYGGCYCGAMNLKQQTWALNLMTAHLVYLSNQIASGNTPGVVVGAGIDKINVTLEPPPAVNQWQYWLQTSPYGAQLLALLQIATVGGLYIGGAPETAAFRRIGGIVI